MREVFEKTPIPYEASKNYSLVDEPADGDCFNCAGKISAFSDVFYISASFGFSFIVSDKSFLCKKCFDELKAIMEQKGPPENKQERQIRRIGKGFDASGREYEIIEDDPYEAVI